MAGRERGRNLAVQVDEGQARVAYRSEVQRSSGRLERGEPIGLEGLVDLPVGLVIGLEADLEPIQVQATRRSSSSWPNAHQVLPRPSAVTR